MEPNSKLTVVWIDHEKDKLDDIIEKIGERKLVTKRLSPLADFCNFLSVLLDPTQPDLQNRALAKIKNLQPLVPDILLVDINFGEVSKTAENSSSQIGFNLASFLADAFPAMAVGVYSEFELANHERIEASTYGFSIIVEKVRILIKDGGSGTGLSADQWYEIFSSVSERSKIKASQSPGRLFSLDNVSRISWEIGHPTSKSNTFNQAAMRLAELALKWVEPPVKGARLEQLSGGFSGSYVVKVSLTDRDLSFILKIDEDPKVLQTELEGYNTVQSFLRPDFYLNIRGKIPHTPVKITEDWWGCFLMDYDGDSKPLVQHSAVDIPCLGKLYDRVWRESLFLLYGECKIRTIAVKDIVPKRVGERFRQSWTSLSRYQNEFKRFCPDSANMESVFDEVEDFYKQITLSKVSVRVPWVDRIHGDLNCRNILYNREKDIFRLIDFPHVKHSSSLAIDFVKAETELILIMMDWSTGRDCDFDRLGSWDEMISRVSDKQDLTGLMASDTEMNRIFEAIQTLRSLFLEKGSIGNELQLTYEIYLFSRLVSYLPYQDLTIQKRFLVFLWAEKLFRNIQRDLCS